MSRSGSAVLPACGTGYYRNGEGDEVIFVHEGAGSGRDDLWRSALSGG